MPRIWKYRGREVSPAQLRLGMSASTSSRCSCPASLKVVASSTDTLAGTSSADAGLKVLVMTTSSSAGWDSGDAAKAGYATQKNETQTRVRTTTCSLRRY